MAGKTRLLVILTIIASLCLFMSGIASAEKTIKVGVMGPFTGPSAKAGQEFKDSVSMALEKCGGKVGDYKLDVVWVDSQSDPAKATSAFAEAIERKGVVAGCINWHSSVAAACMDLAAQYKVPWLFGMGAASIVNEKFKSDKKYLYWGGKGWPSPGLLEAAGMAAFLDNIIKKGLWKPKAKKLAIWGEETDWGRDSGANLKKFLTKAGWEVVSEDYFATTTTDFFPLMAKWRKLGVTFAAGTTTGAASITALVKQWDETGMKKGALLFANGLSWAGDWYKLTGPASDGILDVQALWGSKTAKAFAAAKEKKFGYKPSAPASGLSYDLFNFFLKVLNRTLEKHGKLDAASIHEVQVSELFTGKLTYTDKEGSVLMKEYKYDASSIPDPVTGVEYYFFPVTQYVKGKVVPIFPDSMAAAPFKLY